MLIVCQELPGRAKSGGNDVEGRSGHLGRNVLLEAGDGQAGVPNDVAAVGVDRSVQDAQDGALPGSVSPEQRDTLAPLEGEAGAVEDGRSAKGERDVLEMEEGHGEWRSPCIVVRGVLVEQISARGGWEG
jgi:hypothetical protein